MNPAASLQQLDADRQLIASAYDPQVIEAAGERLVAAIAEHLEVVQSATGPVLNWHEPAENIRLAEAQLQQGESTPAAEREALVARFDDLIRQTLSRGQNLHHPHYVGHQVPASLPLAGLFDAVGAITNQVMAIYEMGPWATAVEQAVVRQIGEAIGFAPGSFSGVVTSGGSLANLTSLLTARNVTLADSWQHGTAGQTARPVLVAHAEAHYSVTRSAGMLGIGTEQVVRVPLDDRRRMDVGELDRILADLRARGVPIVAVSAASCATPTGAFDPLVEIAEVCRRHDVWLHVDAAHGGAACLSERHRRLVDGLQLADSVVVDAHKMMFMPALCAMVFYRNRDHRFAAFSQSAPYLFDPSAPDLAEYDNGLRNLECTKRAAALGLWGVWSMFGRRLFSALVDSTFAVGQEFFELLVDEPDFEPFCRPECNIVVFRYVPRSLKRSSPGEVDRFQLRLRRAVIESGEFYLVQSVLDGHNYLRTTIMNPLTTIEHLRGLMDCLRSHGRRILTAMSQ